MKALIAMSGGVDSAVAALLTAGAGYECAGCTMRLYGGDDVPDAQNRGCCTAGDAEDARSVAYRLGMPHYTFNYTDCFRADVIGRFVDCYLRGETPNPCIDCNRALKFGALMRRAREMGCDCLVTGHYARIAEENGTYYLKKAADPGKDQTYVLYMLTQEQLAFLRLPLGELSKAQVREIAREHGFINADKPDSQDICFVPDGDYASVIEGLTGRESAPGEFVGPDGKVLGRHQGIIRYTVGQRRGLGLSWHEPLYVVRIDPEKNQVVLGPKEALFSKTLTAGEFHWIAGEPAPGATVRCAVKTRYRQMEQPATAAPLGDGRVRVEFDAPQRAVTPGQSAVLYDGDTVLGGGVILRETEEGNL